MERRERRRRERARPPDLPRRARSDCRIAGGLPVVVPRARGPAATHAPAWRHEAVAAAWERAPAGCSSARWEEQGGRRRCHRRRRRPTSDEQQPVPTATSAVTPKPGARRSRSLVRCRARGGAGDLGQPGWRRLGHRAWPRAPTRRRRRQGQKHPRGPRAARLRCLRARDPSGAARWAPAFAGTAAGRRVDLQIKKEWTRRSAHGWAAGRRAPSMAGSLTFSWPGGEEMGMLATTLGWHVTNVSCDRAY